MTPDLLASSSDLHDLTILLLLFFNDVGKSTVI
jgi:hypothetical protein